MIDSGVLNDGGLTSLPLPTGAATEATLLKTISLGLPEYDYVSMNIPALPTVITFKAGGSGGTTVATLTITYSGTDISTVTRT